MIIMHHETDNRYIELRRNTSGYQVVVEASGKESQHDFPTLVPAEAFFNRQVKAGERRHG